MVMVAGSGGVEVAMMKSEGDRTMVVRAWVEGKYGGSAGSIDGDAIVGSGGGDGNNDSGGGWL